MNIFNEKEDLDLVEKYFTEKGLDLQKYTKVEKRASKTPDFKLLSKGQLIGFCELKSPQETDNYFGGNDPIISKLGNQIRTSFKQFDSVNPDSSKLNILAFVNHNSLCGFSDLNEVLTGNLVLDDGTLEPISKKISDGRLLQIKRKIDLYFWFEASTGEVRSFVFGRYDHSKEIEKHLKLKVSEITILHD